jgi:tetratricopeptide (TPR) repeat protein
MKTTVLLLIVAGGVIAGTLVFLNRPKTPPAPAPVAEAPAKPTEPAAPEKVSIAKPEAPAAPPVNTEPAPAVVAAQAVTETNSATSTNAISKSVDALLFAKSGEEKHAVFQQLAQSGQLDAAITELRQRAAADPANPVIPTTLGEALLNKLKSMHDAGDTDRTDMGILALQADQSFNSALKIDPKNWEAQFVKASSMYYWPPEQQRDGEVVQRLSSLIDQQDTMPTQPEFAQSYVVLGNEYQKIGKQAEAVATWQLGAQKFPGDPTLQKKLSGQ